MRIELNRIDEAFHMQATNAAGRTVEMDAGPAMGGHDLGFRPMEIVLAGLAGCSSIDVIELLRKQRQQLDDLKVTVEAERRQDEIPAVFTKIHLHFTLTGPKLVPRNVERALELSITKLCSVAKMLEKTAEITYSYTIAPQQA